MYDESKKYPLTIVEVNICNGSASGSIASGYHVIVEFLEPSGTYESSWVTRRRNAEAIAKRFNKLKFFRCYNKVSQDWEISYDEN